MRVPQLLIGERAFDSLLLTRTHLDHPIRSCALAPSTSMDAGQDVTRIGVELDVPVYLQSSSQSRSASFKGHLCESPISRDGECGHSHVSKCLSAGSFKRV